MKILRLELKAFGPFTDQVMDLSAGREGLHLIFGVNEAGKSTALRGLEQLFFGMPHLIGDDFLHPAINLRLGATLQHSDGATLSFWRSRSRKSPLFAADNRTPLDSHELTRFLGKLDQGLFSNMFGLNRTTLEKAGQEILRVGGQLGQVLFAAGSGIPDLQKVQEDLQDKLDELFKPTGKLPRINKAFTDLREARERLKQHQLPGELWIQHDQALQEAEQQRLQVQNEHDQVVREERRLTRLRDAQPVLARRKELLADLEKLQDAPRLPDDFTQRREGTQALLSSAAWKMQQTQKNLDELDRQLESLEVPLDLLSRAEAIEDLHRRLGEYQKALAELPERERQKRQKEIDVRQIWKNLGRTDDLGNAEKLRLRPDELVHLRKLALDHQTLQAHLHNSQATVDRLVKFLEQARNTLERLETPRDVSALRRAVRQAQLQGPLEEEWNSVNLRVDQAEKHTARLLEQLPGFAGSLEDLLKLTVPTPEILDRFQELFQEAQVRCTECEKKVRAGEKSLELLASQLHQLELLQHIPTEEDLRQARELREQGWQLVRQLLHHEEPEPRNLQNFLGATQATTLVEAFEQSIHQADAVADRLRSGADQVARKEELLSQTKQRRQELERLQHEQTKAQGTWEQIQKDWQSQLPPGMPPLTPRETRAWLARYQGIVQQALQAKEFRVQAEALQLRLHQHCQQLESCLEIFQGPVGTLPCALTFLLEKAQQVLEQEDALVRRRQDLERDLIGKREELDQARADLTLAREEFARWQAHWTRTMVRLELDAKTKVEVASTYLESLQEFFSKLQEMENLHTRMESLQHDLDGFARDVQIVQRMFPLAGGDQTDSAKAVVDMHLRLKNAREAQQRQKALLENRHNLLAQLQQAQQTRLEQESVQKELCRLAGCSNPDDLPRLEQRSLQRQNLERELAQVDQHLQALRGSMGLEEFSNEVAKVKVDQLEADLAELGKRQEDLGRQLKEVDQKIGEERKVLSDMDGSAAAAEDAEQVEFLLAQLQTDSRDYFVRRLALGLLQESIDRYRHKSEGQVVKRASELFALLTLGGFEGLNLDTNEQGETILTGVRAGDRQMVMLEGMSDGTRDQLYLALRLASLEVYLEAHEPIPFIVDDLLLNFDDDRAVGALKALAQLSRRTQVLFFTHHQHLVHLARETLPADVVFFHTLPDWKKGERGVSTAG